MPSPGRAKRGYRWWWGRWDALPWGALTDRFGGRVMFPLVSAATIVPVLYLGLAGRTATPFVVAAVLLAVYAVAAALPRRRSSPRRLYDER